MSRREPSIRFDLILTDDLLDHGHVYKMLKEEVEEWLYLHAGAWQYFGYSTLWFESETERLHFKLRWLNN